MTNCYMSAAVKEGLYETAISISRMNFYLWMYIAQEGDFEEALDFVREKQNTPSPFEKLLMPFAHEPGEPLPFPYKDY